MKIRFEKVNRPKQNERLGLVGNVESLTTDLRYWLCNVHLKRKFDSALECLYTYHWKTIDLRTLKVLTTVMASFSFATMKNLVETFFVVKTSDWHYLSFWMNRSCSKLYQDRMRMIHLNNYYRDQVIKVLDYYWICFDTDFSA